MLVLWALRPVLPDPTHLVPLRPATGRMARVERTDQRYVVGTVVATARRILERPQEALAAGGCHPLPRPFTLGEHMLGTSLLAVLPWAALGDPAAAYNALLGMSWWLAALAMYALAFFWTRDAAAAFVAGLAFGLHPARLGDPAHPYLYTNAWAPLVLLFAHRLFARRRWRDALALALFGTLQLLESFYRVIGVALLVAPYGVYLLLRFRGAWRELRAKLLVVALAVGGAAAALFAPYLEARATWGILRGRSPAMLLPAEFLPRDEAWLGWTLLALALAGLADRALRARPRDGYDPRLVLTCAGLLVAWCSVWGIRVPLVGVTLPSPLLLLAGVVPGLDAVRALRYVWFELVLVASLLAAYGVVALSSRLPGTARRAARAACAGALVLETLVPAVAARSFEEPRLEAHALGLDDEQRALYARISRAGDDGAVLDLPLRYDLRGKLHDMSYYAFLRGYHGRPAAACYNSFTTPVQNEVAALAARLPDPAALATLRAQGFRWIVVHDELLAPGEGERLAPLLDDRSRTELVARARHRANIVRPGADPERTYEERLYRLLDAP